MTSTLRRLLVLELSDWLGDLDEADKNFSWEAQRCEPARRKEIAENRKRVTAARSSILRWKRMIEKGNSEQAWSARFEMKQEIRG